MNIEVHSGLPFVTVTLINGGHTIVIPDIVLDTGSASSLFPDEDLAQIGIRIAQDEPTRGFRGIEGSEQIWIRRVDYVAVASIAVRNLEVGVGPVNYGFGIRGILGLDFLLEAGAVIDLARLELRRGGAVI